MFAQVDLRTHVVAVGTDALGRTFTAQGHGRNGLGWNINPNLYTINTLMQWLIDGEEAIGEDHDNWSASSVAPFSSRAVPDTAQFIAGAVHCRRSSLPAQFIAGAVHRRRRSVPRRSVPRRSPLAQHSCDQITMLDQRRCVDRSVLGLLVEAAERDGPDRCWKSCEFRHLDRRHRATL